MNKTSDQSDRNLEWRSSVTEALKYCLSHEILLTHRTWSFSLSVFVDAGYVQHEDRINNFLCGHIIGVSSTPSLSYTNFFLSFFLCFCFSYWRYADLRGIDFHCKKFCIFSWSSPLQGIGPLQQHSTDEECMRNVRVPNTRGYRIGAPISCDVCLWLSIHKGVQFMMRISMATKRECNLSVSSSVDDGKNRGFASKSTKFFFFIWWLFFLHKIDGDYFFAYVWKVCKSQFTVDNVTWSK